MTKKTIEVAVDDLVDIENYDELISKISAQQRRFVDEFCIDGKTKDAAIRAGYSAATAAQSGWRVRNHPAVSLMIDVELARKRERNRAMADKVLDEYAKIAFACITDIYSWDGEKIKARPSNLLARSEAAGIMEITETKNKWEHTVKIKMHNKLQALDSIGKILGMYDKRNGSDDDFAGLTDEQKLDKITEILNDARDRDNTKAKPEPGEES